MNPRLWRTSANGLIRYVSLTKNKLDEAIQVIRSGFFMHESISKAVGLHEHPEAISELDELVINSANQGMSIIAEHLPSGKIVGCGLSQINVKESQYFFEKFKFKHPAARRYVEMNVAIDEAVDMFSLLQTDCYLENMFIGILPEFRREGVALALQEVNLELVQRWVDGENVRVNLEGQTLPLYPIPTIATGIITSSAMGKIADKCGYKRADVDFGRSFKDKLPDSVASKISVLYVVYKHLSKSTNLKQSTL